MQKNNHHRQTPSLPSLPPSLPPGQDLNQIKDTYKVFLSTKKLHLEPFLQKSLIEYHQPLYYSVCTLGHKVGVGS